MSASIFNHTRKPGFVNPGQKNETKLATETISMLEYVHVGVA
jgi:hypothetical protein